MITTDQLQDGLDQLRDALEAFAFALKAIPIQRGNITVPNDEVTGDAQRLRECLQAADSEN